MAVRETLLAQLVRMRAHGRRATTITPSATKQFQCLRNNMTPHPIVHLSSNEEAVGCNPILHPSSYGEGSHFMGSQQRRRKCRQAVRADVIAPMLALRRLTTNMQNSPLTVSADMPVPTVVLGLTTSHHPLSFVSLAGQRQGST